VTDGSGDATEQEDVTVAAGKLVASLLVEPWGQVSPSVYETGRLVTLAPWLVGDGRRIDFLLASQRSDGSWGGPDGYALVPTLSATQATFATLSRARSEAGAHPAFAGGYGSLVNAVDRGLHRLFGWLNGHGQLLIPDTPAAEIIVPALVMSINERLEQLADGWITGLDRYLGGRLRLPSGMDGRVLSDIRHALESGVPVPEKLFHSLEVAGDAAQGSAAVRLAPPGTVGASPAATAAWLGDRAPADTGHPAVRYLEAVVNRYGGPAPCGMPITVFERTWVLSALTAGGIKYTVPTDLVNELAASLGLAGTPAGPGLPPDADTTAVALLTLTHLGVRCDLDCLWQYDMGSYFCTWPGERGYSTTVNAHVMEALGASAIRWPETASRCTATLSKVSAWLLDNQNEDGSWLDRWHASAYYATACCAVALDRFGQSRAAAAVRRARDWVLATQRADGSWGRWSATVEETAYALQVLLQTGDADDRTVLLAAGRGYTYLRAAIAKDVQPALWHDKDLYLPVAVVRAAVLAALNLVHHNPALAAQATDLA